MPSTCVAENPGVDEELRDAVLAGLQATPKTLPTQLLYDARGAELFEAICELPEYYPTRTEWQLLNNSISEISAAVGDNCLVIEPGAGAGVKTRLLLEQLENVAGLVTIDVAEDQLDRVAEDLANSYPDLSVVPVAGDFTTLQQLPPLSLSAKRRLLFFPGSTIGNFTPDEAIGLLSRWRRWVGPSGGLLLGADRVKSVDILEPAYNDALGITAAFNLNLLLRLNNELCADFDLNSFSHRAPWQPGPKAIRMELVSERAQSVNVAGEAIQFAAGEAIHSEYSHKYELADLEAMLETAGWQLKQHWSDEQQWFSVIYAEPMPTR